MGQPPIWIVVPTVNERENVKVLLPQLLSLDPEWRVVVVDDGSTDGTASVLEAMRDREARLHAILRDRRGLGSALREGIAYAIERGAARVVTMDADRSHAPSDVPRLLRADADLVLGSRYVEGGEVVGWPRRRKAISYAANRLSRFSLASQERDLTTGFRVYSRAMAEIVDREAVAEDYNFQVEAVNLAKKHARSIAEVPITFWERAWGESKLATHREAAHLLRMLTTRSPLRLFLFVGLIGAAVNEVLLVGMVGLFHFHYLTAGLVAVEAGILSSFLLNEKWAFRGRLPRGMARRLGRFHGMVFGGLLLNLLILFLLTEYANLLYLLSNLFAMGTALSWNYLLFGLLARRI